MKRRTINIVVTGETSDDMDLAFDEAVRLVKEGYLAGHERNESGSYLLDIEEDVAEEMTEYSILVTDERGFQSVGLNIEATSEEGARNKAINQGISPNSIVDVVKGETLF